MMTISSPGPPGRCGPQRHAHYRFRLRLGAVGFVIASVQMLNMSLAALFTAVVDWRFASAAMRPRALLATEFAPLSHMLMNGFFLSQGLDIEFPLWQPCRASFDRLDGVAASSAAGPSGK